MLIYKKNKFLLLFSYLLFATLATVNPCYATEEHEKTAKNTEQITIVDDTGYELVLEKPAKRLLALYGAFSELALALGIGDLLVGRTLSDDHIEAIKHLPTVGTHLRPNFDTILSLEPDVILQLTVRDDADKLGLGLRKHDVPVLLFYLENFEDIFNVIKKLGEISGQNEQAKKLISSYKERLGHLRRILLDEKRVRVFFELRYPKLLAAGPDTMVSNIIHAAGGTNVMTLSGRVIRIDEDELAHKRPDAYIIQKGPMNPDPTPIEQRENYATLTAVQNGRVLTVNERLFSRPGPNAIDAAEMLAKWLHPTVDFSLELE